MKKNIILLLFALLIAGSTKAIPAHPGSQSVAQPDGSLITIRLHGDEYLHFNTTDDGYSIVKRADGFYAYATLDSQGQLKATNRIARNEAERSASDRQWLQSIGKYITPQMTPQAAKEKASEKARQAKAQQAVARHEPVYDYNNFRGLLLLVQFNDREFSRPDYAELMNDMVNKENYTGYDNTNYGRFTGSVRDYFYDNSDGQFAPTFDVVGPITIGCSQYDANGMNGTNIFLAAVDSANAVVDFSEYDRDNDGYVDMIYFIFAGVGSHYSGNDSRLLWPHRSVIYNPNAGNWQVRRDGVVLYDYACSTELLGSESWSIPDGIGTICHEFGHVLGLPDLYDTDYEKSGGESPHPGTWSIMAGGSYENNSRTPVGYTLYERYATGFAMPQLLTEEGHYELPAIGTSNIGYRLNTPVNKEFFLIENRQKSTKWDKFVPGSGMLVFRVDSTNAKVWRDNTINCNPSHNYMVLLRARANNSGTAKASDAFPGTGMNRVRTLNNVTMPANLLTWAGKPTQMGFENISMANGIIEFDLVDTYVLKSITLPEQMELGVGMTIAIEETRTPDYAPYTLEWSSSNPAIATVDANGQVTGVSVGQAVITVVANGNEELKAECIVNVEELTLIPDIATYKQLVTGTEAALKLTDAIVLFAKEDNIFIRDASGCIGVIGTGLELETGDMLNGMLYGIMAVEDKIPQLHSAGLSTNAKGFTVTKGHEVEPRIITDLSELTDTDYADLLTLRGVTVDSKNSSVWAISGDDMVRIFNSFGLSSKEISIPSASQRKGKLFDVTGILITRQLNNELINEIGLTASVVETDQTWLGISPNLQNNAEATTPAAIFTTDGRKVAETTIGALQQLGLRSGIYIVKTAEKTWRIAK